MDNSSPLATETQSSTRGVVTEISSPTKTNSNSFPPPDETEGKPSSLSSLRQNYSNSSPNQVSPDLESPIDSGVVISRFWWNLQIFILNLHLKLDIRDLSGLTNFISYKRDHLLPTLIFLYEILVANNQTAVISNLFEININKDSLS